MPQHFMRFRIFRSLQKRAFCGTIQSQFHLRGGIQLFIADAHCDTLHQLAIGNRALADCTVTPERMQRGGLCLQTYAMFAGAKGPAGTP